MHFVFNKNPLYKIRNETWNVLRKKKNKKKSKMSVNPKKPQEPLLKLHVEPQSPPPVENSENEVISSGSECESGDCSSESDTDVDAIPDDGEDSSTDGEN